MGKGKGSPEFWVCRVKPGRIMFELDGVPRDLAKQAFTLASAKLPCRYPIYRTGRRRSILGDYCAK